MEQSDWADCMAKLRALYPQATIDPETAGEWWPTAQRWNRRDCWQAIDELGVELSFPPSLHDLAKRVAQKRFERDEHDRDLVAEVVAEYPQLRARAGGWSDDEVLLQVMFRVNVPHGDEEWVERRSRIALGLSSAVAGPELAERWRHLQALMLTQKDVRKAWQDAQLAGVEAETELELCEAVYEEAP